MILLTGEIGPQVELAVSVMTAARPGAGAVDEWI